MITVTKCSIWILFLFFLIHPCAVKSAFGEKIRKPIFAGTWYAGTNNELAQNIFRLIEKAKKTDVKIPLNKRLKGLILPHAGHVYSGLTAAHAIHVLDKKKFSKIILMGPDHRIGFSNGALSDVTSYQTPLGVINLHPHSQILRNHKDIFRSIPESDQHEHSLELVLPFLQYMLEDFQMIPIVLGPCDIKRISKTIDPILDPGTLVVVSSDLSHFLNSAQAVKKDRETIDLILGLKSEKFSTGKNIACGKRPILVLMDLAGKHHWEPVLLHYSNSEQVSGDHERAVGYAAIAFFGEYQDALNSNGATPLSEKQGRELVKLARVGIMKHLGLDPSKIISGSFYQNLSKSCYQACQGTFVTLKKNGRLRGCMGSLYSNQTLIEGVKNNAVNAAFHDPRFPPLTYHELESLKISVSILTHPSPLVYDDSHDLISKLKIGKDGVILGQKSVRATFLPTVWEQLPHPEEFLSRLCQKAGLPHNSWKKNKLEIQTYQVQYFEE